MTKDEVLKALSNVQEPDLGKDLVTLNMIRDIEINGNDVSFTVVLTTPACPLKDMIGKACVNAVQLLVNKQANVKVNFDASTTTIRADKSSVLPGVKNIICVVSGKGGVGKSTVSANLALALAQGGAAVGLLDADIYGPSVPKMSGLEGQRPQQNEAGKLVPLSAFGLKVMSIGFMLDNEAPLVWRGPMVQTAVYQMLRDVEWGTAEKPLDVLIVDMPPGTGDAQLTLAQKVPVTGAVIVSTPQDIALIDARKAVKMFEKVGVKIFGLIENMSTHVCSNCGHEEHIFGHGGAKSEAEKLGVPFLGEIPLSIGIRKNSDEGKPSAEDVFRGISALIHKT